MLFQIKHTVDCQVHYRNCVDIAGPLVFFYAGFIADDFDTRASFRQIFFEAKSDPLRDFLLYPLT